MYVMYPRKPHYYGPQKRVYWIVYTGGPCSGKSTTLAKAERDLTDKGYKVFTISETATRLITAGISLEANPGVNNVQVGDFQRYIAREQVLFETIVEDAIEKTNYSDIVVLCDRGLIDGEAYVDQEEFKKILEELGTCEAEAKSSYDGVIHLVTAAEGAEKYYTLSNNKARKETPEEARRLDSKTLNVWMDHPHFTVIDNSTGFSKKVTRAMEALYSMLGVPIPIDVYKRYLVKMPDIEMLEKNFNSKKIDVLRTYLVNKDNSNERSVVQRGHDGEYAFYYMEKKHFKGYDKIEVERKLTNLSEYNELIIKEADRSLTPIKKTRYCFMWDNKYYELDILPQWTDRAILKIQYTKQEKKQENSTADVPNFLTVIEEITNDKSYTNYSLAHNI